LVLVYFNTYEKTPAIDNVNNVFVEFTIVNKDGQRQSKTKRKQITEHSDKDYLINFFNSRFQLDASFGCGCPHDDIIITFDTDGGEHIFGLGAGINGDPNIYYYNADNSCQYSNKQLLELLTFFSKFEETNHYDIEWLFEI